MIHYKFREDELINELKTYIDATYSSHYGGGLQSSEVIVDRGRGMDFFLGNVDKYNARYGKKGSGPQEYRKDLMKILHYSLLALYEHDRIYNAKEAVYKSDQTVYNGPYRSIDDVTVAEWNAAAYKVNYETK